MSRRSEFLTKLADLMEEYGVLSIDTDSDEYAAIEFDMDDSLIVTNCRYLYVTDVRKFAAHYEVKDVLENRA